MPWVPLDYRVFTQSSPFENYGSRSIAVVAFPAVGGNQLWRLEELQVQVLSPAPIFWPGVTATVFDRAGTVLYLGSVAPFGDTGYQQYVPVANIVPVDSTLAGNFDVAEYSPPVTILEGNQLAVYFVSPFEVPGGNPGLVGSVRAQVAILGGVSGQPTPVAGAQGAPSISASL